MELNFIKCGDYYIPDIKLKNPNIRLGKWGRMRKEYLRLANPVLFSDMVLNETLYEHCAEIEETAKKRMEIIVPQLAKAYGVTEQLKAENQIEWVRQMNACVAQADLLLRKEREFMILEAIFNGEIYPAETVVPKSEKFREAGQAIADIMRYFEQTLSKEDYAKLDKLNDNFADCQTMQTEEHFKYGFTMGVLLMKEIYELSDFK